MKNGMHVAIDPRRLKFHRSRIEPTDPAETAARNARRLALADSWLENPISDIIVRDGDLAIANGNERVSGIIQRNIAEITVLLLPADTTDAQLDEISMLDDYHKTALTQIERAILARKLKDTLGIRNSELAVKLRMDPGYVTKSLSIFDCPPAVLEAATAGKIGVNDWYAISKSDDPLATLALKLGGASREQVQRAIRKPAGEAVRTARIRCPLPTGVSVQVAGDSLDLETAIDALGEAVKLMKSALAKGLNVKTAMNFWKDVAAN